MKGDHEVVDDLDREPLAETQQPEAARLEDYGDEIGMGDNVYLGDRDGVRTPMQWTGDRNAGFSRADWAQLYLQPLITRSTATRP